MYKYLQITENLQEMMVMIKSLPAYTLVFDAKSNLVDMNQSAKQLLRINSIQEFNSKQDKMFLTHDYIKIIIRELKKGKTIRYARTVLKYADDSLAIVELCACMINGCRDLFLFQLFEISLSTNSTLVPFISDMSDDGNLEIIAYQPNRSQNSESAFVVHEKSKTKERRSQRSIGCESTRLEKARYRKLTKIETVVCKLMSLNLSIPEIAIATNKTNIAVRVIIRRVEEKQKLNSKKELIENCGDMPVN